MRKKCIVCLIGVLLLFAGMGLAQEGYIHISPYAWNTWDSSAEFLVVGEGGDSTSFIQKTTNPGYLYAPVYFPPEADGLLVRQITISYYDSDATNSITFVLRKVDLYDQSATTVTSISSSGSSSSWRRMYINRWDMNARRINNERYAWYIAVYFYNTGSDLRLGNIKIKYAAD